METILGHSFFTHDPLKIPESLPACCTHVAPDWQEERNGRLVPVLAEADEAKYRSKISKRNEEEVQGTRHRDMLATRDTNRGDTRQYYPSQKNTRPSSQHISSNPTNKFEIYNEIPKDHRTQRRKSLTPLAQHDHQNQFNDRDDLRDSRPAGFEMNLDNQGEVIGSDLADKMSKCDLQETPTESKRIEKQASSHSLSPQNDDLRALEIMHERLRNTNLRVEEAGGPTNFKPIFQARKPGADLWVTRYVDYTSKYGLGFLFNDGR